MSKSRNKNRSEVEHLRGRVRKLEAQLKYYKKRELFFESPLEEIDEDIEEISANQCEVCKKGLVTVFDFTFATLEKCSNCTFERRKKKT